ncbi:MAG: DUF1738 domain-containing protein [Clostridia bacterium]|nr:DUF1738 domain-containing protein [Clostridia bacterium]MBO5530539.1 DUF1738 domain-containing protein [Bacilli bacterium]
MKQSKTREQLIQMYIESLKQDIIPWRQRWIGNECMNGISHLKYKGVNQLLLSYISSKEKYNDSRWYTYIQVKQSGYKLNKQAKGKGVPVEFWSCYNIKTKQRVDFDDYQKIIELNPEEKNNYRVICNTSYVFNAKYVDGLEPMKEAKKIDNIEISNYISKVIKKLGVKYSEEGNRAYYNPTTDEIVLPNKDKFVDNYSYYATQLHELCHSTGNQKRLNRNMSNNNKEDYAREELIAEISSSFLMQKLNVDVNAEHYDNHKAYIQSWIRILEDKPSELFKAINESNKVCKYIDNNSKIKTKEKVR